jgi:hypothetical protein
MSGGGRPRLGWLTSASLACALGPRRYDALVAGSDPGDRIPSANRPRPRPLSEPPSARFVRRPAEPGAGRVDGGGSRSAFRGPVARAGLVAVVGAILIVGVGGILAYPFGLPFIAGGMGVVIGLLTARAAVPDDGAPPAPRRTVLRVAMALALGGIVLGDLGLWLFAHSEGGVLGPIDYLWTTFGLFVPGVALVAAVTAWWGAGAGPVQR